MKHWPKYSSSISPTSPLAFFLEISHSTHMHFEVQLLQIEGHIAKKDLERVVVHTSKSFV
jgi:hypothetical protein